MKILILYVTRSGSNSIAKYFMAQNPEFKYFNQPWSLYNKEGITKYTYRECLSYENVLVKCEIFSLKNIEIDKKTIVEDFDKIVLLSRKNKNEQAVSFVVANSKKKFINSDKLKYFIDGMDKELIKDIETLLSEKEGTLKKYQNDKSRLFFYEDLFYGNFDELLAFLNLKYIQKDYDLYLNINNRYKEEEFKSKSKFTII